MSNIAFKDGLDQLVIGDETPDTNTAHGAQPQIQVEDSPTPIRERILDAYDLALASADRVEDPEYAQKMRDKLAKSNVRGSRVEGIKTHADVHQLLGSISDWKKVVCNKDPSISVFQGTLPREYEGHAYAAYASIREIFSKFGLPGLSTIQAKQGYQREDEFYLCTTVRCPTDIITVQLKSEATGLNLETVQQWFAGPELSSIMHLDDGDNIVRCGVQIPLVYEQQQRQQQRQGYRKQPAHGGNPR